MKRIAIIALMTLAGMAWGQVSPWDYGLREAKDGLQRYEAVRRAHVAAVEQHTTVSYAGIDTLYLEVPSGARSIPLAWYNDFGNTLFVVKSHHTSVSLFGMSPSLSRVAVGVDDATLCAAIDGGDYSAIPELSQGSWLVEVTDSTIWVDQREGYSYGHYRQELLRIHNGRSIDRPAMPYSGTTSKPRLRARRTDSDQLLYVGHLGLLRDSTSTADIDLLYLENLDGVTLNGIIAITPAYGLVNDATMHIYGCADLLVDTAVIMVSSGCDKYAGYGLQMNNCRNSRFHNLYARSPWGVFGTNNMYNTLLEDCDMNRFDIHCYGRDVTLRRCLQTDTYNQLSSVFGTVRFDSCRFENCLPLLIEESYNVYNHFSLVMRDCWWHVTRDKCRLIRAGKHTDQLATRPEMREKCLPDIDIDGLTLQVDKGVRQLTLIHYLDKPVKQPVGGIGQLRIHGVHIYGASQLPIRLTDTPVSLSHPVRAELPDPTGRIITPTTITALR